MCHPFTGQIIYIILLQAPPALPVSSNLNDGAIWPSILQMNEQKVEHHAALLIPSMAKVVAILPSNMFWHEPTDKVRIGICQLHIE
jgi:hypothetical protein